MSKEFLLCEYCLLLIWIYWCEALCLQKLKSCECWSHNSQHYNDWHHLAFEVETLCLLQKFLLDKIKVHEFFVCLLKLFCLSYIEILCFVYHFNNFSFHVSDDVENLLYLINILKQTNFSIVLKRPNVIFLFNVIVKPHFRTVREISHIQANCLLIVWFWQSFSINWNAFFIVVEAFQWICV